MTIDECLRKLCDGKPTVSGLSSNVRRDLRALILTESERAAGVLTARCDQIKKRCWDGDNIARQDELKTCHDEILATSPGKGGSSD